MSNEPAKLGYYDKIPFGKHKGKTIARLIDDNINYVKWLVENKVVELDNESFKHFESGV